MYKFYRLEVESGKSCLSLVVFLLAQCNLLLVTPLKSKTSSSFSTDSNQEQVVVIAPNVRLNATTIAFLSEHSAADFAIMVDQEFFTLAEDNSLKIIADKHNSDYIPPFLIVIMDETCDPVSLYNAINKGAVDYEAFLQTGDPDFAWKPPKDEWQSIVLGYTSDTTSNPNGVVLHHRGVYQCIV